MKTKIENNTLFIEIPLLAEPVDGPRLSASGKTQLIARSGDRGGFVKTEGSSERPVLISIRAVVPVPAPADLEENDVD